MTKSIPPRPNLEFDRKQAKALLKALQAPEPAESSAAGRRFETTHPRGLFEGPKIADAQIVIAREYGFPTWQQWKAFVETRSLDRQKQADIALRAICSNDLARARVLLRSDPALARENFDLAVACGEFEVVQEALERDPALARRKGGVLGWEPLEYACFSRWLRTDFERTPGIVAAAQLLLKHGAGPNAQHAVKWGDETSHETVLFGAAGIANHAGLTELLLAAGADVNEGHPVPDPADPKASPWGTEALYHACEFRDTACLALLLAARPHAVATSYCLGRALDFENPEAVKLFLAHGADPNFRIPWIENRTHLHRAIVARRSPVVIGALLEAGADVTLRDSRGLTSYQYAVRHGSEEFLSLMGKRGAGEVTERDRLLGRIMRGEFVGRVDSLPPDLLGAAARRNALPVMEALLAAGADLDAGTPLHLAAWCGRLDAARLLVERGANVHRVNGYGADALGSAIHGSDNCFDPDGGPAMRLPEEAFPGDYPELVEYLIARGAKLPKHISCGSEAVREILRKHGVPDEEESTGN